MSNVDGVLVLERVVFKDDSPGVRPPLISFNFNFRFDTLQLGGGSFKL